MERQDETADLTEYVRFGDVAIGRCKQQCQYAVRYLAGVHGSPDLGSDLRWIGDTGDYHDVVIHKGDVEKFVARYLDFRDTGRVPGVYPE